MEKEVVLMAGFAVDVVREPLGAFGVDNADEALDQALQGHAREIRGSSSYMSEGFRSAGSGSAGARKRGQKRLFLRG